MLKGNPWLYYKTREGAEEALQEQRLNNDQCSSTDAVLTTGEHRLPYLRVYDRTQNASTCWWLEDVPRGLNMEEKTRRGFLVKELEIVGRMKIEKCIVGGLVSVRFAPDTTPRY
jgi:hypothetical protein